MLIKRNINKEIIIIKKLKIRSENLNLLVFCFLGSGKLLVFFKGMSLSWSSY